MKKKEIESRRKFIKNMIALSVSAGYFTTAGSVPSLINSFQKGVLPTRPLGKTGYNVGIFSLGGQATLQIPGREEDALKMINRALDLGINYIDTAAMYGRANPGQPRTEVYGTSERYIGQVMKTRRKEAFIATKTHDRTYDGSMKLLEQSLKNLQTDKIDLWQIHDIKRQDQENLEKIFAKDGVLKAMQKAKDEGMVDFLGITSHTATAPVNFMIKNYPFDAALVAINGADKHYDSMIEQFLPLATEKHIGVIGMKIPARDRIFMDGGIITMKQAMEYVLTFPVSTVIIGCDNIKHIEENVEIAKNFKPLSEEELLEVENLTKPFYKELQFFKGLSEWPSNFDW